ncbi:AAA family ATPase [Nocardia sp. CA-119907]|uniref:AAA family ATPase n=1 Tax=Nocardia sp. CA-119907 TaxID=3239973 RepID=UPI003D95DDD6
MTNNHTQGAATPAAPSGGLPEPTAHCRGHGLHVPTCQKCKEASRRQIDRRRAAVHAWDGHANAASESAEAMTARLIAQIAAGDEPSEEREAAPAEPRSLLAGMFNGAWLDKQVFPPLEWLVEGIVSEGFGLLVGAPKAGKSWMAGGLALACSSGGFALGKIAVKQRPVFYLALEDGPRRLQSRFRTMSEGGPLPAEVHFMITARPNEVPGMIAEFLHLYGYRKPLIILDTLGKVKPPKLAGQESYSADYAMGSKLKELTDSAPGSCLLAVHHSRKAESVDFVDAVSGTQGIAGSADFVLVLSRKRKEDRAVLAVTGRDVPENEYALTADGGRWELDGMDLLDAAATVEKRREAGNLGDRSMDIYTYVMEHGPTTPADVAKALSMDNKLAGNKLAQLYESGRIDKPKRGTYDRIITTAGESGESGETDE